ncbi:MAG: hypothetical protein GY749_41975, partial [Desulfobacteraceae bacterium]|nr:hypothetical protein [Desulfobacteraceae bacterium]
MKFWQVLPKFHLSITKTVHLVPTLCVGMQTNSASRSHALRGNADRTLRVPVGTQEDCFGQPETGRGASRLHSH